MITKNVGELTYQQRLDLLRQTKLRHTEQKQRQGPLDNDDHGRILPPTGFVFKPKSNHPTGGFFGPKVCGENFRLLLESHPVYVDPMSSLAGGYMVYFNSYRDPKWKPELDWLHLRPDQKKYNIAHGIDGSQHFCPELTIGLQCGWGGLLEKVRYYRKLNAPTGADFYDGLENVILGIQNWISRHAEAARQMAETEENPQLSENLETMADINERLVMDPPRTFREVCQWIAWFQMAARMYNGSGALGALDEILFPYYEQDKAAGILTDEEAIFHLACLLLNDTQYVQVGGVDVSDKDETNPLSFLILEAVHRLKTPANVGVCVHDGMDENLLHKAVEILFEDKMAFPKFLGDKNAQEGFVKNGYPIELARQRVYSGCHWFAIPGREYTMNDIVKINFAAVFDVALREMMADPTVTPNVDELWRRFEKHLKRTIEVTAEGIDYHLKYEHEIFPELVLDLFCHGTIEKGLDVTNGGVEYYNMCVDGAGLATVADSFAALEQRIEKEGRLTWQEMLKHLDNDFKGAEDVRLMLRNIPRYGLGGTRADEWAVRVSQTFTRLVKEKPTPAGFNMIPGLFSWINAIGMGRVVGATPNGRHAYAPISHGANPDPGFIEENSAPTAMAVAVAAVQCGYGNTAPLQLDMDPNIVHGEKGLDNIEALIRGHFALGGTMININVINKQQILEAHKDPSKYPNLIVRVTGFSAYFASLSEEPRQIVVDRIISEET